ncbi:MAG: hypothetical protein QF415_12670 [Candidatus Undinarchaeales archaeon]|jgi:hypothetical protein|nr:hypothetical protein [Candidatus Undinarchaeales archaeon]MDP7492529.1 hypothetical protein [Candidatus Undinarchaeales archaeon]
MGRLLKKLGNLLIGRQGHKGLLDWDQDPYFFGERFDMHGYDREIDEGRSSGMVRFATLDVSELTPDEIEDVLDIAADGVRGYSLCKQAQVMGFYGETGREQKYIAISGECHSMWQGAVAENVVEHMNGRLHSFNQHHEHQASYVNEFIPNPSDRTYTPTDLGPYGTTGGPQENLDQADIDAV